MKEISKLNNPELVEKFNLLVGAEREVMSQIIYHLAEIDRRKLFAEEGYSSLFNYCVQKYHYSEEASYRRIQAARLSQKFPEIIELLESGSMNLTTINLISPYVTPENKDNIFRHTKRKTKREIELYLVSLFPKDEPKDSVRRLPVRSIAFASEGLLPTIDADRRDTLVGTAIEEPKEIEIRTPIFIKAKKEEGISPLTPQRFKIEFSGSQELAGKIQRVKELLKHKYPQGKLEDIMDDVIELFLEKKDPERKVVDQKRKELSKLNESHHGNASDGGDEKALQSSNPRRFIPVKLKLKIWEKDEGQCSYRGPEGRRCHERAGLEMDHIQPFALGGKSSEENLRLLCRTHNQWRAHQTFGRA